MAPPPRWLEMFEVGHVALDAVLVFFVEGHPPHLLARRLRRAQHAIGQALVGDEGAREPQAQRDHDGPGQRGQVHHLVGLDLLVRVHEGIGQGEASLGVGVADLDGEAIHSAHDVARPLRSARGHVLRGRDEPVHLHGQLQLGQGGEEAEHGGGARHVVLHAIHAVRGLQVEAARVEGDALADHRHALARALPGLVGEVDKLGRLQAALGHAHVGAHAELLAVVAIEHLEAEPARLRDLLGAARQIAGIDHVRRLVDEVARQAGGGGPDLARAHALLRGRLAAPLRLHHREGLQHLAVFFLQVLVEAVGAEHCALHRGLRAGARREAVGGEVGRRALRAQVARAPRPQRSRAAHRLRVALAIAQAQHEHARGG